ncbi:MAG: hypothetical protein C0406_01150 [Sideroxydans sp.]|nr:hypothetical protein [Sideroxydans sp.]
MPNQFRPDRSIATEVGETQNAFIARGLASLEAAKKSGEYVSSDEVLRALDEIIANAKKKQRSKST